MRLLRRSLARRHQGGYPPIAPDGVRELVAKESTAGFGLGEVLQKRLEFGAISGFDGANGMPMKIISRWREQARRVYYGVVFGLKKRFRLKRRIVKWDFEGRSGASCSSAEEKM
jgi:hypothetical protein